ncbi:hypothetical protein H072_6391 [Dactylellina haptotyla CBS 200.50]|uniref:Uncharacterized protein n=1 Tax=Dactylellina haptotyla (strain CBS 200.50) TaxID=1284197 RepID=S8AAB7_DACHA|nr:hypothetical protein H072_6391 [Dactylellina haptotyla CBS 200.50]
MPRCQKAQITDLRVVISLHLTQYLTSGGAHNRIDAQHYRSCELQLYKIIRHNLSTQQRELCLLGENGLQPGAEEYIRRMVEQYAAIKKEYFGAFFAV